MNICSSLASTVGAVGKMRENAIKMFIYVVEIRDLLLLFVTFKSICSWFIALFLKKKTRTFHVLIILQSQVDYVFS